MKILLVEDDPVARTVLAKILAAHPDIRTTVAEDGEAAWNFLDDPHRTFDVVLLDLSLPKVDGFTVLERLRGNPLTREIDVVLCTAAHDRATVVRAVGLGVRHYLVKPCTEATVFAKLTQLGLGPKPTPPPAPAAVPPAEPAPVAAARAPAEPAAAPSA